MSLRTRKRSAAITLVLAGGAALSGCSDPLEQRDAYVSLQDCTRDWSESALCEPVTDGRFSRSYFYGPAYYASDGFTLFGSPRAIPSANAMDAVPVPPGTVARSPASQTAMRAERGSRGSFSTSSRTQAGSGAYSGSRSSGISRGGFGSSGRSSVS